MLKFSPAAEQIWAPVCSADQGYSLTLDNLWTKKAVLSHASKAAQIDHELYNC